MEVSQLIDSESLSLFIDVFGGADAAGGGHMNQLCVCIHIYTCVYTLLYYIYILIIDTYVFGGGDVAEGKAGAMLINSP